MLQTFAEKRARKSYDQSKYHIKKVLFIVLYKIMTPDFFNNLQAVLLLM